MKSRTSHQNRASISGSRHLSTSSLIRHAMDETYSQHGDCGGGRTRISWAPCSENKLGTVPGEASGGELISAPRLTRSPAGEGRRSRSKAAGLPRSHSIRDHARARQEDRRGELATVEYAISP